MPKCFFYLKDGSDSVEGSFGLKHFEADSAVAAYALTIAKGLRSHPSYRVYFVVAMDQGGKEIARILIGEAADRVPRKPKSAADLAASSLQQAAQQP